MIKRAASVPVALGLVGEVWTVRQQRLLREAYPGCVIQTTVGPVPYDWEQGRIIVLLDGDQLGVAKVLKITQEVWAADVR